MILPIARAVLLVIALQTPPPTGTGIIAGVTVDQTTGRPLGGVTVYLRHRSIERDTWIEPNATSDARGRFMFRGLPRGEWSLHVKLDGWLGAEDASQHHEEEDDAACIPSPQVLEDGQRVENVRLGLRKYATLTGRVIDSSGAPIAGAEVNAMSYLAVAGRQTFVSGPTATTDAKGVYRFTSLVAGEYALTAAVDFTRIKEMNAPGGEPFVFQRAPSRTVTVTWGQTPAPINFTLRKGPAVRVTGQVTGASSFRPQAYVHLLWTDPVARADQLFVANSYLDGHGNFSMAPVPPGRYELTTYGAHSASGRMLWTRQPVVVGATNITDLKVPIRSGLRVIGRAQFDGTRRRPTAAELESILVVLSEPDLLNMGDMMPPLTTLKPDGTFTSVEMAAGQYVVRVWGEPDGWMLRSAIVAGTDAADTPIHLTTDIAGAVLTFTDRSATIRGRVVNDKGQAAAMAHVLVFPANSALWTDFGPARRLRKVTTSTDGNYELPSLPAGDYLVTAVASLPRTGWRDHAFLRVLAPTAARVSLAEGENLSLPLLVAQKK